MSPLAGIRRAGRPGGEVCPSRRMREVAALPGLPTLSGMVIEDQRPDVRPAGLWRQRPIRRMIIVGGAAAAVSMVWHLVVAKTVGTLGEVLFPGPFGGFGYIAVSVPVGLVLIGLVLAALRVGAARLVWVIGSPLAVGGFILAAAGAKILNVGTWQARLGVLGWLPYVLADSLGVAVAFMLAAVITDARLPGRVRLLVPAVVLIIVVATWAIVYNVRY